MALRRRRYLERLAPRFADAFERISRSGLRVEASADAGEAKVLVLAGETALLWMLTASLLAVSEEQSVSIAPWVIFAVLASGTLVPRLFEWINLRDPWYAIGIGTSIAIVTVIALQFGALIAFAIVTESIFAWPGIGKLIIDSIRVLDRPVVVAYLLMTVALLPAQKALPGQDKAPTEDDELSRAMGEAGSSPLATIRPRLSESSLTGFSKAARPTVSVTLAIR